MIKQIHVNECDSTQNLLKEQLMDGNSSECVLISCESQTSGRGRGENKWKAMAGTICFSFNLASHKVLSLTALEISVLTARFFETKGKKLFLKWPNDLWNEEYKKCGGILVQGMQNLLMAGIGINIYSEEEEFGGIFNQQLEFEKSNLAREITEFIIHNRYDDPRNVKRDWLLRCGHLNQMVQISESGEIIEGIFQGLGEHGEALVCCDGQIRRLFNGSLRLTVA